MMEQTQLFLATVRTIRLKLKAQRRDEDGSSNSVSEASSILRKSRRKTEFSREATEVVSCVTKLRDFLMKHRKEYINSAGYLVSSTSGMTDLERDEIDSAAQDFIHSCSKKIEALHQKVADSQSGQQVRVHRQAVYESLRDYLKSVCQLYSEQRAMRVKRIVDRKRIFRLQPESRKKLLALKDNSSIIDSVSEEDKPTSSSPTSQEQGSTEGEKEKEEEDHVSEEPPASSPSITERVDPRDGEQDNLRTLRSTVNDGGAAVSVDDGLTVEEREMFEQENEQLFSEMNSMVDEVRQIEGKVLEISRLQEIFTEKVLVQAKEIDLIHGHAVEASENVKDGNEKVRGAIKSKASFRLWILFVLIVFSFSLLFLDWYN